MSLENTLDYGAAISILADLQYRGNWFHDVEGMAYSYEHSPTLKAVSISTPRLGEVLVEDPSLHLSGIQMDDVIAAALWAAARKPENLQRLEDAFEEARELSRYSAETEAAMSRVG